MFRISSVMAIIFVAIFPLETFAHKFRSSKARAVVVATPQNVNQNVQQNVATTNIRQDQTINENVNVRVVRQQDLIDQTNFFVQTPAFGFVAGANVPINPFNQVMGYVNPYSAIQYGSYQNPQMVCVPQGAMQQSQYQQQTQKKYTDYAEEYRIFLGLLRAYKQLKAEEASGVFGGGVQPQVQLTTTAKACGGCHIGSNAKKGFDVSNLSLLTGKQRITAIRKVTSDDPKDMMPPPSHKRPSPSDIGLIIQELASSVGEVEEDNGQNNGGPENVEPVEEENNQGDYPENVEPVPQESPVPQPGNTGEENEDSN